MWTECPGPRAWTRTWTQRPAHRVWTRTESWYIRSYMQIFRSTVGLGTQTGTSMATPMALKYSWTGTRGLSASRAAAARRPPAARTHSVARRERAVNRQPGRAPEPGAFHTVV